MERIGHGFIMANNIFREKSLERISSPEEMDRYIRIPGPGIWLILAAMIVLLVSGCLWGIWGRLETVVTVVGTVAGGEMTASLASADAAGVEPGMEVDLGDEAVGVVGAVSDNNDGTVTVGLETTNLADGKYQLNIVVERIRPVYFLLQ